MVVEESKMDWAVKIAILTSMFGDRDVLQRPNSVFKDIDYYAFVDRIHECDIWKQKIGCQFSVDSKFAARRNAKIYKILPELFIPGYDYYFWIDATHEVIVDPSEIINTYLKNSELGCFKHTTRTCAYDEGKEIINLGLHYDYPENVINQLNMYNSERFPQQTGLWEMSCFIRKNTANIQRLNLMWWEQICRYSSRDQISFPYCLWKTNIVPTELPGFANGININTGNIGNNPIMPQRRSHIR
jgi:hypothetical protein